MADHFKLDIDPAVLRKVAKFLGAAEEHVRSEAEPVRATPDDIGGDWTGRAATSVKREMTELGDHMSGGQEARFDSDAYRDWARTVGVNDQLTAQAVDHYNSMFSNFQ